MKQERLAFELGSDWPSRDKSSGITIGANPGWGTDHIGPLVYQRDSREIFSAVCLKE
jgi:hypothetical protein